MMAGTSALRAIAVVQVSRMSTSAMVLKSTMSHIPASVITSDARTEAMPASAMLRQTRNDRSERSP